MKNNFRKSFQIAQTLFLFGLTAAAAFAQSGDISSVTTTITTLGQKILVGFIALAGLAFVGVIIWGALTLSTNRPRGLAMVGSGIFGALLAGLAFILVSVLTGQNVSTGALILPVLRQIC